MAKDFQTIGLNSYQDLPSDPKLEQPQCGECNDSGELESGEPCTECCEHCEHDHGICLDCGADCMDMLIAKIDFMD